MYDRVLVPTDGSEGTSGAVEQAIDLAKLTDAALHTLYVVETGAWPDTGVGPLAALEAAGERAIERVVHQAESAGVGTVEGSVARGAPYRAILAYVDDNEIDLVVMGTHGRTGLERYLLGSVTEKVVRLSAVPVLTVGLPDDEPDTDATGYSE